MKTAKPQFAVLLSKRLRRAAEPRESKIEADFVRMAKAYGWVTRKMNGRGNRSWPDRLVLLGEGRLLFVEFKRPGEKPTVGQEENHKMLRALGIEVLVATSAEQAIQEIHHVRRRL